MVRDYQYAVVISREDGTPVGQSLAEVDWVPAEEWARFCAIRAGWVLAGDSIEKTRTAPAWDPRAGEPYLEGFHVRLVSSGAPEVTTFPLSYFQEAASRASAELVRKGLLERGELFRYKVVAYLARAEAGGEAVARLSVRTVTPSLSMKESSLSTFVGRSAPVGDHSGNDYPVFISRRTLDEAVELCREAGDEELEAGGFLIGHLHRDTSVPEVFAEVTAQIPARHTQGELNALTFTAQTWSDVQAAIDLRGEGEIMLGWFHSHPVKIWCRDCTVEKQRTCPLSKGFFSDQDRRLHRTVFGAAFHVAIVVSDLPHSGPTLSIFGWRRGMIETRGVHVITDEDSAAPATVPDDSRMRK